MTESAQNTGRRTWVASQFDYLDTDGELLGTLNRFPTGVDHEGNLTADWYANAKDETEIGWYPNVEAATQALRDWVTLTVDRPAAEDAEDDARDWSLVADQVEVGRADFDMPDLPDMPRLNVFQSMFLMVMAVGLTSPLWVSLVRWIFW